ncbi:hypothetical protein ABB37_10011 [Leptomonas pyrrhocoris]|uniref:BD-FAE-like domain-containing protein n=1 Tax=Leptomonas pyrrhocoris TaxID=157538 RepID=A0A0M9FPF1_LEPPY|nr:hypothetical protein ABB37_10011 [Leptomonas pyrrhocoris]XP_015651756.1 hypothetical protein ABB37_10011 [Leptomonas pyrrhocoris]KPA73316.1 hypothetical protein ABB37_10011 [Leptomonas pyrrhocoris]KPA73317.1 hypothetical protein ABB37_10011 [Leptomonas pyrrhocoris]|eukprot:XP_015651755.1 hypothetical protein ABB37_10011 [Leptomonas pyrrhocoris]
MLPYTLRQLVWMLTSALQLIYALSTGVVWVAQMLRLFAYGACVGVCFIPHWWWYLTSPNIIRRVSYRSSDTTKKRNILRVLEAEGVDLHEVLRKGASPPPLQQQPSSSYSLPLGGGGVRRRRVLAGPRNGSGGTSSRLVVHDESAGGDGGGGGPLPHYRRPASDAATVSSFRRGPWSREEMDEGAARYYHGSGGGKVMEATLAYPHSAIVGGGGGSAAITYPRGHSPSGDGTDAGGNAEERGEVQANFDPLSSPHEQHSLPPRRSRRAPPPRPQTTSGLFAGAAPRRRRIARAASEVQGASTALGRLMEAAPVHLNPADGSALRSFPAPRSQARDDVRVVPRRPQLLSLSPHRTPPRAAPHSKATALEKGEIVPVKQSSSSSCDMTVNRPENSSGDDDRGVGSRAARGEAQPSCTPQLRSCTATAAAADAIEETDASSRTPLYEGRPVYYEALPPVGVPNDPLLKDVLAALHEGEAAGAERLAEAPSVEAEELRPRAELHEEGPWQSLPAARSRSDDGDAENSGGNGDGGPGRPLRRSRQRRLASPQHPRTFSEENILAGLDEEDEEDRMNLHNRATVDIVLPVPLDSLMKTLEYTQHSKRLRRKRFPVVIDVTGAVWIIGSHLWSTMMARVLAQRGYVVFCPDYRNFPQTTMEGMTLDVSDAIAWVLNNADRYNGDLSNVTLIGQSAGAHLTMMSLLSQAQLSAYRNNTLRGTYESVPPPSDVAYNVPRYNPRESIHRYVGLSGMYNVEGLVDHFQHEGLNTPVLHQIAGGRDQLARYSIHAYFDDRRGGDTGEVLPDNVFDYFPQRMFFVHGDADKCAPVTESASLVAMLRGAQARYAVRRSERNAEARRHALRSRRLLPGVSDDGAPATYSTVHRGANVPSSWTQRNAGKEAEDFERSGNTSPTRNAQHPPHRVGAGAAHAGAVEPADASAGQSNVLNDGGGGGGGSGPRRRAGNTDRSGSVPLLSQQQPTVARPFARPSRHDEPKSPVELEFIVIPNGRHSDAFVDECIAAGRSCCVDLLCDYESAVDFPTSSCAASLANGIDGDSLCGSPGATSSSAQRVEHVPAWMAQSSEACAMPDGILPLAVPTEERSLPLRLCTLICPF